MKQECIVGISLVLLGENCIKEYLILWNSENQDSWGLYSSINNIVSVKQKISSEKYELWELY